MKKNNFASIENIINVAKKVACSFLVDDEKRENEGDL
jgi:3,4-dihydroxy 2-butanone 4-phosphate synthase/GTP cyclohydrolase II